MSHKISSFRTFKKQENLLVFHGDAAKTGPVPCRAHIEKEVLRSVSIHVGAHLEKLVLRSISTHIGAHDQSFEAFAERKPSKKKGFLIFSHAVSILPSDKSLVQVNEAVCEVSPRCFDVSALSKLNCEEVILRPPSKSKEHTTGPARETHKTCSREL